MARKKTEMKKKRKEEKRKKETRLRDSDVVRRVLVYQANGSPPFLKRRKNGRQP